MPCGVSPQSGCLPRFTLPSSPSAGPCWKELGHPLEQASDLLAGAWFCQRALKLPVMDDSLWP